MKILYLSTPYYFDMDLSLIQSLSKKGDVYYLLDLPTYALKSSALEITKQPSEAGIFNAAVYPELNEVKDFIQMEKTFIINRISKKTLSISNLSLQKQIVNFIKGLSPDIIHCNGFVDLKFFSFLLRNSSPKVQIVHDPFPHSGENSYRDFLVRKLNYSFFRKKILLNYTQKEEFIKRNNISESDLYGMSLGPYTHLSRFATNGSKVKPNHILFFGRISLYKGIDYLIRSVKQLSKDIPDIKLTIAGSGDFWFDTTDIEKSDNFRIINKYISTTQLVELLNENELVVCPYIDATQSGVIMTAYAFCKPVIATNVGGLAEMVEHNVTGKLVGARNEMELSEAIKEVLTDKTKLSEMRENIKNRYFEGSESWDSQTDKLIEIYTDVISA